MITDREWIQRTLDHVDGDPVPYHFSFTMPARRLAREHYGTPLEDALSMPVRRAKLNSLKPLHADPDEFGAAAKDDFGVVWATSKLDRGVPVVPCLPEPDLSHYDFPDPAAPDRFAGLDDWCAAQEGHYRIIWVGDLWERATFMRGMENLLTDAALRPAFVESLLERIAAIVFETISILVEQCDFEAVALSDDYGAQNAMLISPADWRKLVKPHLARIYALAKKHGRAVFHHSCGNIEPIIGDMIDIGLDILHPIQPEAMDILRLKKDYGAHLTFCGGVPTQRLLTSATPEKVRSEVRRLKKEMGRGGGYILEPGITIQADVPLENLIAMIDEACLGS